MSEKGLGYGLEVQPIIHKQENKIIGYFVQNVSKNKIFKIKLVKKGFEFKPKEIVLYPNQHKTIDVKPKANLNFKPRIEGKELILPIIEAQTVEKKQLKQMLDLMEKIIED